jgi:CRISPR/Cas system-associated exonuclease Cas4 (RecB family)
MPDKYAATWVSHTSISDFLACPRAYYLKNMYKDPDTNHKVQIMAPPLALGSAVHEVVESLSVLPVEDRFKEPLLDKFKKAWKKVSGKRGGFTSEDQERRYYRRGEEMLRRVMDNPGPIKKLAVKIKEDLPHYWLSEEDEIILCGKVDWLEYLPDTDSVHIIDFKTGKSKERDGSLQLPIYHLLVHNTQQREVDKASYWYLAQNDSPTPQELPDLDKAHQQILEVAKKIKLQRQLDVFKCPQGGECFHCGDMERILRGEGEKVGVNDYNKDIYMLPSADEPGEMESGRL